MIYPGAGASEVQTIRSANVEAPGDVENEKNVYSVRLMAKFNHLNELRNTVIAISRTGGKIKVMDVAEVEDGTAVQKLINRIDDHYYDITRNACSVYRVAGVASRRIHRVCLHSRLRPRRTVGHH